MNNSENLNDSNESGESRWHELIALHQTGAISDAEMKELETILRDSKQARALYRRAYRIDGQLRHESEQESVAETTSTTIAFPPRRVRFSWIDAGLAAAVVVLLGVLSWSWMSAPKIVATLASSEDAAWESPLPTAPGSELAAGSMNLTAGIATLKFRSGAEMTVEAPARVHLETAMRARLDSGAAILDVPESAVGFVLELPDGRVVDYGTSFAVHVGDERQGSTVEVIEGEVAVHQDESGKEVRLKKEQGIAFGGSNDRFEVFDGPLPFPETDSGDAASPVIRVGTGGLSASVIRANREKWMHPDKLMVKRRLEPGNHERRSFFSFDLSGVDLDRVESVRLRLNQVPSGIGFASRLDVMNRVSVYGVTDPDVASWSGGENVMWAEGPTSEDGELLGFLELPRSQQRGSRFFGGNTLLDFLRGHRDQHGVDERITFLLDGALDPATGEHVRSLVLAFASDTNPEAPGPMLEFVMRER